MKTNIKYESKLLTKNFVLQDILHFTRYFFKKQYKRNFIVGKHHILIAQALDKVIKGETKKLIINIAPRFGKTELAVKNFIAYGFAVNPKAKFIHLSYSDGLARDNSLGVQSIVNLEDYQDLFPDTMPVSKKTSYWQNVKGGGLYAISSAGQVTGFGAGLVDDENGSYSFGGAIIIDDPIKPDDALSPIMRQKINTKFETTIRNRVNSRNTPIIIIMQRLHEQDLCGYLLAKEREDWEVLSLPAIETDEDGNRKSLWEHKFTLDELDTLKRLSPFVFETQYMQNPKPLEGLMYEQEFKTYDILPTREKDDSIKCYIDTADTGEDYLCSIVYLETKTANYILDVIYTQKSMEYTEVAVANQLTKYNVEIAHIESNNGGRGFARNVEKNCRLQGNNSVRIKWFSQNQNKEVRIFTRSAEVQNLTIFPKQWKTLYFDFANSIISFMKTGHNNHDDGPDALTGTVEMRKPNAHINKQQVYAAVY